MSFPTGNESLNNSVFRSETTSARMRDILPNLLWIGNARDARDVKTVLNLGIGAVIDLAMEEPPISFPREIIYCRFPLLDGEGNPTALLQSAIDTTANFVNGRIPTLVACSGGMSRSPAVVSAVLSKMQSLDLEQAVERVAASGPCDIALGFWKEVKAACSNSDEIRTKLLDAVIYVFQYHKRQAERAVEQVPDEKLHISLDSNTNSIAVIMKHVSGNLVSRWTDFLMSDGEKPDRNRDGEFVDSISNRAEILDLWERGWTRLFETLNSLSSSDLARSVFIRGEPHTVPLALERSLGHTCYHVGQIVQLARFHAGDNLTMLTVPKGGSEQFIREYWGRSREL